VVFVLTEFQIVDARTAEANEIGENSHERYKERQIMRVKARLAHGMKDDDGRTPPPLDLTGRQDGGPRARLEGAGLKPALLTSSIQAAASGTDQSRWLMKAWRT